MSDTEENTQARYGKNMPNPVRFASPMLIKRSGALDLYKARQCAAMAATASLALLACCAAPPTA
eukprot:scaffold124675_cov54-Phaeocystis_antarctica.AAC.2